MPKAIRGVYENGKIKLSLKELPEATGELQVVVVFLEDDTSMHRLEEDVMTQLDITSSIVAKRELKAFSIADSSFFSLPPEHLGKTSAETLDEIIAKESLGCE